MSWPTSRVVSAPRLCASRSAASTAPPPPASPPGRSTVAATQLALRPVASRLAARTTSIDSASGPTQTSRRSLVSHGPPIAPWRNCSTIWSSTRAAVRRSAISRSAVRLRRVKNFCCASRAVSAR